MVALTSKAYHKGLTLIEVLVALAIISIALLSVMKSSSQTIRSTSYLEDKTIALWVAQQALNEVRVGLLKATDERMQQTTMMLGKEWYWTLSTEETPNAGIEKVIVRVAQQEEAEPIVAMEGYVAKVAQ